MEHTELNMIFDMGVCHIAYNHVRKKKRLLVLLMGSDLIHSTAIFMHLVH